LEVVRLLERSDRFVGLRADRAEGAVHGQVIALDDVQVGLQLGNASAGWVSGVQGRTGVEIDRRERFILGGERRMRGGLARAGADRDGRRHGQCQASCRNGG
jgi:hypothetical protein